MAQHSIKELGEGVGSAVQREWELDAATHIGASVLSAPCTDPHLSHEPRDLAKGQHLAVQPHLRA